MTYNRILNLELELEKADHGMGMPRDPERVAHLKTLLADARKVAGWQCPECSGVCIDRFESRYAGPSEDRFECRECGCTWHRPKQEDQP